MTTAEETVKEKVQKIDKLIKHSVIEMVQKPENDNDFRGDIELNQKQESAMAKNLKRRVKPYTSSRIKIKIKVELTFLILVLKVKILSTTILLLI